MRKVFIVLCVLVGLSVAVDKAPWFSVFPQKDLAGNKIVYDKQAYLIDVWATWCPPCRMTVPVLISIQDELPTKNFTVIGLSVDTDSDKTVLDFIQAEKVNYPVAKANETLKYFPPVRGIPTMFVLDKNGKIKKMFVGYTEKKTLLDAVKKVMGNEIH
jgi:thiol-disulfide isomerase/thioredoxin